MRRLRTVRRVLAFSVTSLLVLALSPAVLLAGELVNRHYRGHILRGPGRLRAARTRWRPPRGVASYGSGQQGAVTPMVACRQPGVVAAFVTNPLWIALTAPARWLSDRLRPLAGRGRRGGGPPSAGVREPRRPKPNPPAGVIALPEPRWPS